MEGNIYKLFFNRAISELSELLRTPVKFKGYDIILRVHMFLTDLLAKAPIANIKQFNGEFGCPACTHSGEYSKCFHKRIYKPNICFELKTNENYKLWGELADTHKTTLFGIKGVSSLSNIISLPDQMPFDYMHLICQGHTKWLISQIFFANKSSDCYLNEQSIEQINIVFKKTRVPHIFNRKLNSVIGNYSCLSW